MLEAYYKDHKIRLYLGDVVSTLERLPDASIDVIFADPPYNLSNDGFTCHAGKRVSVNKGDWDKSSGLENDWQFHYDWIKSCHRVLKQSGTLWISGTYHSIYVCGHALQSQGWHIINDICWYKPNAAPNLSCRMFTASHETLLWAKKTKSAKHTYNYESMKFGSFPKDLIKVPDKQMRSVWMIGTPRAEEKKYGKHPTQKPEDLLTRIILSSSNEGDIILDPFCGSATTGVCALRNNRRFVGIDNMSEYIDTMAIPRIKDVIAANEIRPRAMVVNEDSGCYSVLP